LTTVNKRNSLNEAIDYGQPKATAPSCRRSTAHRSPITERQHQAVAIDPSEPLRSDTDPHRRQQQAVAIDSLQPSVPNKQKATDPLRSIPHQQATDLLRTPSSETDRYRTNKRPIPYDRYRTNKRPIPSDRYRTNSGQPSSDTVANTTTATATSRRDRQASAAGQPTATPSQITHTLNRAPTSIRRRQQQQRSTAPSRRQYQAFGTNPSELHTKKRCLLSTRQQAYSSLEPTTAAPKQQILPKASNKPTPVPLQPADLSPLSYQPAIMSTMSSNPPCFVISFPSRTTYCRPNCGNSPPL
jgi:hypothetical protein